jgi:hypothetical protein
MIMAYYSDVSYLEDFSPQRVRANSAEYRRVAGLIASALPELDVADDMEWQGAARVAYRGRLAEARQLVTAIGAALRTGAGVLDDYAAGIDTVRHLLTEGRRAEGQLGNVLAAALMPVSVRGAESGEPMRWWDGLQSYPDVDLLPRETRDGAQLLYDRAARLYGEAREVADRHRDNCVARLTAAREELPRYELAGGQSAPGVLADLPGFRNEVDQARANPDTRAAPVPAAGAAVSPELAELRARAERFPDVGVPAHALAADHLAGVPLLGRGRQQAADDFIRAHAGTIEAAARHDGVPAAAVATILRHEMTGTPAWLNRATELYRRLIPGEILPGDRNPDTTSYGAGQIQIRRAAEVLGYDPDALTDAQRDEIRRSLDNAAENILITAGHLAQLQDQSAFAGRPPDLLGDAEHRELFRLYNDGPAGEASEAAREYATERMGELDRGRRLLGERGE